MMKKPEKSPRGIVKMAFLMPVILLVLGISTGMSSATERTLKGKVVEAENGEAMPGTSIVVKGSTTGTVADMDGSFSLKADSEAQLVFSFVGYKTQVIKASTIGKKPVEMELTTTTYDLDEVETGGISYAATDGITIESAQTENKPVIVLDGEVVHEMDHLDPDQIEKIEVLKDPGHELVKKYNAKDGLVIITTRDASYVSKKGETLAKKSDAKDGEEVFYIVEDMPQFPGGKVALKSYIYTKLKYPAEAREKKIEGEVQVQFTVSATGTLKDVKVVKSTYDGFNEAAKAVFLSDMPTWKPGKQRGKPVQVQVIVPVKFELEES